MSSATAVGFLALGAACFVPYWRPALRGVVAGNPTFLAERHAVLDGAGFHLVLADSRADLSWDGFRTWTDRHGVLVLRTGDRGTGRTFAVPMRAVEDPAVVTRLRVLLTDRLGAAR